MTLARYSITKPRLTAGGLITLALMATFLGARAQESEPEVSARPGKSAPVLQPRQFSAIAHDTQHHEFLLFGGTYGSTRFDDTWILGPSGWKVQKLEAHPAARISSAAAYDSDRNEFVLFGGRVKETRPAMCSPGDVPKGLVGEFFCSDTWVFNGRNWVKKEPASSPPEREGHAMAFDAARKEVVLFGGTAGNNGTPLNDTWIWNGTDWKQLKPRHRPPSRFWHTMAYDPVHRQVVMFGGDSGGKILNDTWLWDGKDWQMSPHQTTAPQLRTSAGMDYDATLGKMVLFSGSVWNSRKDGLIARDSWIWNGAQWKKLPVSDYELVTDFSKLKPNLTKNAILANGSPSYLWVPRSGSDGNPEDR